MEFHCLLGLKCRDFTMIAADELNFSNVFVMKSDDKKIHKISEWLMLAMMGNKASSTQLVQYITKNLQLYRMKNLYSLNPAAVAHFVRHTLTSSKLHAMLLQDLINTLLAGYDDKKGGQLYYLDCLGACVEVPHVGLGFGGMICTSIMDSHYSPSLTEKQAYELLQSCVKKINHRLILHLPKFQVSVVSKDGVQGLPPLVPERFQSSA